MIYTSFKIQHYRSFQDQQTLKFAIPVSDKPGSGITFIVGENNTGKTTLIEGLFMHDQQKIRSSEIQQAGGPVFELYGDGNVLKRKLQLIRAGSYTLKEDPVINVAQSFEIIPSRRHWQSTATGNDSLESVIQNRPLA